MLSRKNTAERTAAQAWDYLSTAMAGAGESAKDAGRQTADLAGAKAAVATAAAAKLADKASKRAGKAGDKSGKLADKATVTLSKVSDEAFARATLAANALAGRKPGVPWGLVVGVGLLGVALGWVAATTARAAVERRAVNEELELAETVVVATPTYDN